jgi:hypothetical protein
LIGYQGMCCSQAALKTQEHVCSQETQVQDLTVE